MQPHVPPAGPSAPTGPVGPVDPSAVPAGAVTEARLIEMVFPNQTNHYGTLFGGQALALMDKAAFIAATRFSRRAVVTAHSESVDFHVPVRQGELVEAISRVIATGRTSMTVEVELYSEELLTGTRRLATRGRLTMVALDSHGKPAPVPPLPAAPQP
jgi:uncharacterized protein (TIGR00369 family)